MPSPDDPASGDVHALPVVPAFECPACGMAWAAVGVTYDAEDLELAAFLAHVDDDD